MMYVYKNIFPVLYTSFLENSNLDQYLLTISRILKFGSVFVDQFLFCFAVAGVVVDVEADTDGDVAVAAGLAIHPAYL